MDGTYGQSGWHRALRALSASFRLGHAFGVEVRIYWLTVVLVPLILVIQYAGWGLGLAEILTLTTLVMAGLYVVIWTHEMSHILAARRYHIQTPLITLSPMGGVAHIGAAAPHPRADMRIAAAGPAVHLIWIAALTPLVLLDAPARGTFRPDTWLVDPVHHLVGTLWRINLALFVFNLLPFFPMDGGRIFRAFLAGRMHPNRATLIAVRVGMVGAVLIAIAGFFFAGLWGPILLAIGITNFLACLNELRAARYSAGPYAAEPLAAWEADAEAWKRGGARPARAQVPSRRERRETRRRERERERASSLEAEVDRILEKVSEVGVGGLTARERRTLDQASRAKRER